MRAFRLWTTTWTTLGLLAMAATGLSAQQQTAVQKLEARTAADPRSVAALRALGVAYFKAERFRDAHNVLERARQLDPRDGVSALYAGLSAEELEDYTAARTAYNDYLRVGRTRRVRRQIQQRLVALARTEVVASAKAAVANEAALAQTPGDRRTIAVPPLKFVGTNEELQPLERGLAEMLITDLSRSSQLTVVERDRMQAIADEIRLGESDRTDAATAARAGKLLRAGRLVSGGIVQSGDNLQLTSSIVEVSTATVGDAAVEQTGLDAFFAAEKRLALKIFEQLGVTLTPAERQLVDRTPTTNLQAFLAYSRGLQAADDGRFEDAARFFNDARSMDPNFGAAAAAVSSAQAAAAGAQVSASTVEASLAGSAEGNTVDAAAQGNVSSGLGGTDQTLRQVTQEVNPPSVNELSNETSSTQRNDAPSTASRRDAPSEAGGTATLPPASVQGRVTIVIRRP